MKFKATNARKPAALLGVLLFVAGCSIKIAPSPEPVAKEKYDGPKVTYMNDISPLLERSCTPCHFPTQDGRKPPLDNYTSVKNRIESIIYRVELPSDHSRHMPFRNKQPDLTVEEIAMLKNWARGGFLEG